MSTSSPEPTLLEEAADKGLRCSMPVPSDLISAWLLLTLSAYMVLMSGDSQD